MKEQQAGDILEVLVTFDELLLEELVQYLQEYLIEKQQNWVDKNFVLVLNTIHKFESCKILQNHCLETICSDSKLLIT